MNKIVTVRALRIFDYKYCMRINLLDGQKVMYCSSVEHVIVSFLVEDDKETISTVSGQSYQAMFSNFCFIIETNLAHVILLYNMDGLWLASPFTEFNFTGLTSLGVSQ